MCGIAGIHIYDEFKGEFDARDLNTLVDGLLSGIEPRGRDATGIVAVNRKKKVFLQKEAVQAEQFIMKRRQLAADVKTVLLHTRAQTQGPKEDNENNHPVVYRSCFATHNGMIRNDDEILKLMGLEERPAAVDSIVVPVLMDAAGGFDKLPEFLRQLKGSYALACLDPKNNPDEVMLVRGASSPLYYIDGTWFFAWASSASAIRDAWELTWSASSVPEYKEIDQLDEGQYIRIKDDEAVVERYIPKDEVWEKPYRHRTTYTGYSGLGDCFECGESKGVKGIPDSYKKKNSQGEVVCLVSWELPLCEECQKIEAGDLTYRHADRELKMKYTPVDSICATCDWFPKVTWSEKNECQKCYLVTVEKERKAKEEERNALLKSMGLPANTTTVKCADCDRPYNPTYMELVDDKLKCKGCARGAQPVIESGRGMDSGGLRSIKCNGCQVYFSKRLITRFLTADYCSTCLGRAKEKMEGKTIASWTGDDKETEQTVLTLNPGDEIPLNVRSAFKNCQACNHNNVRYIGDDGFAICTACRRKEEQAKVDTAEAVNLEQLQEQVRARIQETAEDNPMYDKCVACPHDAPWILIHELNMTAFGLACDDCYQSGVCDIEEEDLVSKDEPMGEVEVMEVAKQDLDTALLEQRIKFRACLETGWEFSIPGGFVMWCLDCKSDELMDKDLREKVEDVVERYGDNKWLIEALIRAGRDDLIPSDSRLTEEAITVAVALAAGKDA